MNIGIIGSGGREHALSHFLYTSKKVTKIFCIPGNAGTSTIAENLSIDLNNFEEIKKTVIKNKIDFIIVGPEKPLVEGLVDYLKKYDIKVFGPNKIASQLEGSKIFTKELCEKYNIPTAKFGIYKNNKDAIEFLNNTNFPIVIKADGLASGKGVYIPENKEEGFLGRYYGTDINEKAGYLFDEKYKSIGEIIYGDSISSLQKFDKMIDLFINDSDHLASYEYQEYQTIKNKLSPKALILGDNSHVTNKLLKFSIENDRNFVLFREEPKDHWYPGAGIGISFPKAK